MTERLYYSDSYLTEFDARVTGRDDGGRRIYLDRTAFYPASGGQPSDTGSLGSAQVVELVDEGERVAHVLSAPVGEGPLHGSVDWGRRWDHMQQHTGQHLLSAVIAERFGHPTVSVHFGGASSTLDLDTGSFSPGDVAQAEALANDAVSGNRPVTVSFEEAAAARDLRKSSDRQGRIRVVTIEGLDRSACGGTHVRATGEIGAILIRKMERVRQQVRLEFLCGGRAVRRSRAEHELLARLAAPHSASPEELPGILEAQRAELKTSAAARRELEETVAAYRARELIAAAGADPRGRRIAVVRESRTPVERLRSLAQAFCSHPGTVFVGALDDPAILVIATAADTGLDAGKLLKSALGPVGGRGGGNARLAQGTVPGAESLQQVIEAVSAMLAT